MLELKNISFSYGNRYILRDINISFNQANITSIVAPSGYGKTTLANIIAGYETLYKGEVLLNEKQVVSNSYSPIQLIPQNPLVSLNSKLTIKKQLQEADINFDITFFDIFDIKKEWLDKLPNELSGGELQKVCIARALNEKTKFIIADEITSNLDAINQAKAWKYLLHIVSKHYVGLICITHDINLAKKISDKIIKLDKINNL